MSIVSLNKVTIFGSVVDREKVLESLQSLGFMHLIPLQPSVKTSDFVTSDRPEKAEEALRYLLNAPRRRHQVTDEADFDFDEVVEATLANKQKRRELEDQQLFLQHRIEELRPWGNFTLPSTEELGGYRLWFYRVPHTKTKQLEKLELPWQRVFQDQRFAYLVVIAQEEPPADALPVPRTHAGAVSLEKLQHQLQRLEVEIEDVVAEHEALSRWILLFSQNQARAEDRAALKDAGEKAKEEAGIFLVQGWMPSRDLKRLNAFVESQGLALHSQPPLPEEMPPTLIQTSANLRGGKDLVSFYETPGYRTWDPSIVVFFSFALFFAMILSDAGYALVLTAIVVLLWQKMGQSKAGKNFRILAAVGVVVSFIYGVLVGSYFGMNPPPDFFLARLNIIDINNYNSMMQLSITIGCLHLAFANAVVASNSGGFAGKAKPIGWIAVIAGGFVLYLGSGSDSSLWGDSGIGLLGGGVLLIFLGGIVGSSQKSILRIVAGFSALTQISKLFGDAMSYLRLFALGLASASLALTFNQLAEQVYRAVPGLGLLLSILILLLGHGINLTLAIISGFVHGLRLNFIEFFNWGIAEEGYPFQAFAKKENNQ